MTTARAWPLMMAVVLAMTLPPSAAVAQTEMPDFPGVTTVPPKALGDDGGGVYCGQCGRTAGKDAPEGSWDWLHDLNRQGGDSTPGLDGEPVAVGGGPGGGAGGGGVPSCTPVAPRAPSPMWAGAPLPSAGDIATDPARRGWTGLTTYFTWTGPDAISWTQTGTPGQAADCTTISAPTATLTARVVRWHWDVGETTMTTTDPQTEHFYERKGRYELTVMCEWAGDPAGVATMPCGQRDYEVWEIRSTPVNR